MDTGDAIFLSQEADFEDMIDLAENMERQYGHLFDKVIVNGDIASAFRELRSDLEKIQEARVQWVPTEWSFSSPTKARRSCSHLPSWIWDLYMKLVRKTN